MVAPAPAASWMPIGELSRRVGVSSDLLRKWERRYEVMTPRRTPGNQRLYSRVDEARVRLMLDHVSRGVPAAQAAELAVAARFRIAPTARSADAIADGQRLRDQMLERLEAYDETGAERILEGLLTSHSATAVIRDLLLPLLREVGERWADDHLSIAQEHFVSAFVHSRLLGLARGWDRGLGPRAVLACPSGELHAFGLIAFGIALHQVGWRITYLGPDTPVPMIAEAALAVKPALIVISVTDSGPLEPVLDEVRALARRWPVAIGGAGAGGALADACGVSVLPADPVAAAASIVG